MSDADTNKLLAAIIIGFMLIMVGVAGHVRVTVERNERAVARRAMQRYCGKTREEAEKILNDERKWEEKEYGELR